MTIFLYEDRVWSNVHLAKIIRLIRKTSTITKMFMMQRWIEGHAWIDEIDEVAWPKYNPPFLASARFIPLDRKLDILEDPDYKPYFLLTLS